MHFRQCNYCNPLTRELWDKEKVIRWMVIYIHKKLVLGFWKFRLLVFDRYIYYIYKYWDVVRMILMCLDQFYLWTRLFVCYTNFVECMTHLQLYEIWQNCAFCLTLIQIEIKIFKNPFSYAHRRKLKCRWLMIKHWLSCRLVAAMGISLNL